MEERKQKRKADNISFFQIIFIAHKESRNKRGNSQLFRGELKKTVRICSLTYVRKTS